MAVPTASWILLGLAACGAGATLAAVLPGRNLGWGNVAWFALALPVAEFAAFHVALSAAVLAAGVALGALAGWPGQLAALLMLACWLGLGLVQWRSRPTAAVLERALADGLGRDYRAAIPAPRRARLRESLAWSELAAPFVLRRGPVDRLRDVPYGKGPGRHPRWRLDVYRPREPVANAPVLLQVHGGGWTLGRKDDQALPLVHHLAARGWIVVAPNYRLSPAVRFPEHLVDCKRALAWIRTHAAALGGDPGFVAVTGGSAGAHLATLLALTANRPALQPGFESVDTRVAACVPLYGVYDFADRERRRGDGGAMTAWLARTVMPGPPEADPALWDLASPLAQVHADAPPFFVLHGTYDSLARVEEARLFVARLRACARAPVLYAELPGAQHAFDLGHSVRTGHAVHAIARFLEWVHATRGHAA